MKTPETDPHRSNKKAAAPAFPAVLSAGALILLTAGLFAGGPFARPAVFLSSFGFGTAAVLLFFSFRRSMKEDFYSISTVTLPGLCLFSLAMAAVVLCLGIRFPGSGTIPGKLPLFRQLLRGAVLCTLPLVLVFSVLLLISNFISDLWLIRNGRGDRVNFQGLLSAAVLCGGSALVIFSGNLFPASADPAVSLGILLFLFAECMLFSALVIMRAAERHRPPFDRDFLIILGCGLYPDGRPSSMLRNRMKAALRFYEEQLEASGKPAFLIASGGQGPDEVCSEAQAMKGWLTDQGLPEERLLMEDRSRSTEENMLFSKRIIESVRPGGLSAFCTTNFHAFRAGIKARRIGLDADGVTYQTEWYFWYNAAVREVVGLLMEILARK